MAKQRPYRKPELNGEYRFSFGPWNIDEGADPFGPTVRRPVALSKKIKTCRELGFHGMQFHDDDAVPDVDALSAAAITKQAKRVRRLVDDAGLEAEFVAPRLQPGARAGGVCVRAPRRVGGPGREGHAHPEADAQPQAPEQQPDMTTFKALLDKVRSVDRELEARLIKERNYEELDRYLLNHLMGVRG